MLGNEILYSLKVTRPRVYLTFDDPSAGFDIGVWPSPDLLQHFKFDSSFNAFDDSIWSYNKIPSPVETLCFEFDAAQDMIDQPIFNFVSNQDKVFHRVGSQSAEKVQGNNVTASKGQRVYLYFDTCREKAKRCEIKSDNSSAAFIGGIVSGQLPYGSGRSFEGLFDGSPLTEFNVEYPYCSTSNVGGDSPINTRRMFANCPNFKKFNNRTKIDLLFRDNIIASEMFKDSGLTELNYFYTDAQRYHIPRYVDGMFENCKDLVNVSLYILTGGALVDCSRLFKNCPKITSLKYFPGTEPEGLSVYDKEENEYYITSPYLENIDEMLSCPTPLFITTRYDYLDRPELVNQWVQFRYFGRPDASCVDAFIGLNEDCSVDCNYEGFPAGDSLLASKDKSACRIYLSRYTRPELVYRYFLVDIQNKVAVARIPLDYKLTFDTTREQLMQTAEILTKPFVVESVKQGRGGLDITEYADPSNKAKWPLWKWDSYFEFSDRYADETAISTSHNILALANVYTRNYDDYSDTTNPYQYIISKKWKTSVTNYPIQVKGQMRDVFGEYFTVPVATTYTGDAKNAKPGDTCFGAGIASQQDVDSIGDLIPHVDCDDVCSPFYGRYMSADNRCEYTFIPAFVYRSGRPTAPSYKNDRLNALEISQDVSLEGKDGWILHRAFINAGKKINGLFVETGSVNSAGDGYNTITGSGYTCGLELSNRDNIGSSNLYGCQGKLSDALILAKRRGNRYSIATIFHMGAISMIRYACAQAKRTYGTYEYGIYGPELHNIRASGVYFSGIEVTLGIAHSQQHDGKLWVLKPEADVCEIETYDDSSKGIYNPDFYDKYDLAISNTRLPNQLYKKAWPFNVAQFSNESTGLDWALTGSFPRLGEANPETVDPITLSGYYFPAGMTTDVADYCVLKKNRRYQNDYTMNLLDTFGRDGTTWDLNANKMGVSFRHVGIPGGKPNVSQKPQLPLLPSKPIVTPTKKFFAPGEKGFGVGVAENDYYYPYGISPYYETIGRIDTYNTQLEGLPGYNDPNSDNFGNYIHKTNYEYEQQSGRFGSIMVWIPAFKYRVNDRYPNSIDIWTIGDPSAPDNAVVHRAFYNGLNKSVYDSTKGNYYYKLMIEPGFFCDKYLCSPSANNVCAVSVKNGSTLCIGNDHSYGNCTGQLKMCDGNMIDVVTACRNRNSYYGYCQCMSIYQLGAIRMLTLAHAQACRDKGGCAWYDPSGQHNLPHGNNSAGLTSSYDQSLKWEQDPLYPAKGLTGSCSNFAMSTHNGQANGIADIYGIMNQVVIGYSAHGSLRPGVRIKTMGKTTLFTQPSYTKQDITITTGADIMHCWDPDKPMFTNDTSGPNYEFAGVFAPTTNTEPGVKPGMFGGGQYQIDDGTNPEMFVDYGSNWDGQAGLFDTRVQLTKQTQSHITGFRACAYATERY